MTERSEFVAWRGGKGIKPDELLGVMGPGLAPGSEAPFVPAARWSEVIAAIAVRLLRAVSEVRPFQEREADVLVRCARIMAAGSEHDAGRYASALEAIALLNTARIMAESRPPTVESALSWFPAPSPEVRHARLDRKCPYKLSELAAEAAAHHAALAGVQGTIPRQPCAPSRKPSAATWRQRSRTARSRRPHDCGSETNASAGGHSLSRNPGGGSADPVIFRSSSKHAVNHARGDHIIGGVTLHTGD